jgi:hypothetical protein
MDAWKHGSTTSHWTIDLHIIQLTSFIDHTRRLNDGSYVEII